MTQTAIDPRVIQRVRKLLALAADGGATEAEAQLAAEKAREIMAENGLSTATVEASGGAGEARLDTRMSGLAGQWYQPPLMEAVCKACFVHVDRTYKNDRAGRTLGDGYRMIGRESGIATAQVLFEYLCQTIERMARETTGLSKPKWFRRGMSERLIERINARHEQALAEQARAAREQNVRAQHPGSASTSNALVVVLEDYVQKEHDLNEDMRRGWPAGTTAANRAKEQAEMAAWSVEYERKSRERRAATEKLVVELGVLWEVAAYMVAGFTREHAEELAAPPKPETEAQRRKREAKEERERQRSSRRNEEHKRLSPEWRAGRVAAESVGLDPQIKNQKPEQLT